MHREDCSKKGLLVMALEAYRVAEVFWEDPEVDSKMENDEPYDESDDCSANL